MPETDATALPREIVVPTTRARLHASVWGTALLVFAANVAAGSFLYHHAVNQAHRVIDSKWRLLEAQSRPVDWLVLGDSSGNHGVVPRVLGEKLGGRALNLCTVGNLVAVGDSWMLESYIEKAGAPRRVLIVHAYDIWRREVSVDAIARVPLPFGFWTRRTPPLHLRPRDVGLVALERYAPLYSQDQSLSRLVTDLRKTMGRRFDMDEEGHLKSTKATPEEVLQDAAVHLQFVKDHEFELSDDNRRALESIADMARRNGFKVYIANGPLYEGLYRDPAFRAYYEGLRRTLGEFARSHPPLTFLEADPMTFPAEDMTNADHLIETSAMRYTEYLASLIAAEEGRLGSIPAARVQHRINPAVFVKVGSGKSPDGEGSRGMNQDSQAGMVFVGRRSRVSYETRGMR